MDATSFGSVQSAWFSKCLVFIGELKTAYSRNRKFPWVGLFVPYNMKLLFVRRGVVLFTTVRLLRPWKDHGNNMHFQTSPYFTTPMLTICEQSFLDVRFLQELVGPTPILSLIDAFAICSTYYRLVFVSDLSVRKCMDKIFIKNSGSLLVSYSLGCHNGFYGTPPGWLNREHLVEVKSLKVSS